MKTAVKILDGDISRVAADAMITAINSGGMWFGGIDGVIQRVAGNYFHEQANRAMPLKDGQTVVAKGNSHASGAAFKNVVFVVDDLKQKLRQIIINGLEAASDAGFSSVTIPAVRMGVMLGVVEASVVEAVTEIATGVKTFLEKNPDTSLQEITFVIFRDKKAIGLLNKALPQS